MRPFLLAALALAVPSAAAAQYRPASPVAELSSGSLHRLVSQQRGAVSSCASRTDSGAFLVDVRATVAPGPRPSTMFNARIHVSVRSRHRDGELEACVRRAVADSLRHQAYAVPRTVRTRRTFRVAERPGPPEPPPAVAFSQREVRAVLSRANGRLARCLDVAGLPEQVTLHVSVDRTGRMILTNANLPPGVSGGALGCLSRTVSSLRTRGRPGRRVQLTHVVGMRSRAW